MTQSAKLSLAALCLLLALLSIAVDAGPLTALATIGAAVLVGAVALAGLAWMVRR